jgi:PPOX class probable F420-dependent enzyme
MPDHIDYGVRVLEPTQRAFVDAARRATLATTGPDGRSRLVPVCFVVIEDLVYTPLDEKPKQHDDPMALARVRDVTERPGVTLLVDRWDEDWGRLAWVRLYGTATLLEPRPGPTDHARAIAALRVKYPQYEAHALERRPVIRIAVERIVAWGDLGA